MALCLDLSLLIKSICGRGRPIKRRRSTSSKVKLLQAVTRPFSYDSARNDADTFDGTTVAGAGVGTLGAAEAAAATAAAALPFLPFAAGAGAFAEATGTGTTGAGGSKARGLG